MISMRKKGMIPEYKLCSKDREIFSLSFFSISQDYYKLPKRTSRANGIIYHIFKPNNFRDVLNIYQDKSSMDMYLNEFNLLTTTCWNKKYQPLTIDITTDKFTGRYRLGLNSICVADSSTKFL